MPSPEKIALVTGAGTGIGKQVALAGASLLDANVPFLTVMATTMPFIGRG